ncbi:hypothetical protein P885DRAFT_46899 [Corynascus similis CBS 632.67]
MRSIYFGLVAALCWTGSLSVANPAEPKEGAGLAITAGRRRLTRSSNRHRFASSNFAELGVRQSDGQCGANYGRCPGDLCCSEYGFCGDSIDHCHPLFRCQPDYGTCGWPREPPVASTSSTPPASTSTSTSTSSAPSTSEEPPSTTSSSSATQPPVTSTSSTIPSPTGALEVTEDGRCGNNTICIGNPNFGPCCSQFFWCGSSEEFCGAGCQSNFGACMGIPGLPGNPPTNTTSTTTPPGGEPTSTSTTSTSTSSVTTTSSSTTSSSPPQVTLPAGQTSSTDGRCGNNVNCLGSNYGRCCSQFGWCGDSDVFCSHIAGCQPNFGYCDPQ